MGARTPEQEQLRQDVLVALAGGLTVAECSEEFSVPTSTIYTWAKGYGIVDKRREEREKAICKAYTEETDLSVTKLCAKYDIGQNTLYRLLAKYEVPNRVVKDEEKEKRDAELIIMLFDAGVTMSEIQRRSGKGYPFMYRTLEASGRRTRRSP
jgi:transposase